MPDKQTQAPKGIHSQEWNHSSREQFLDYYAQESASEEALYRFISIRDTVLRIAASNPDYPEVLAVADIGCGAGTSSIIWSEAGHQVYGLDVNKPLVALAKKRAATAGCGIDFRVGSATKLPWADNSMDVCLVPELLEHVPDWVACINEFTRVLRPGGILYLTTSNRLCPIQQEFNLPLYSWYPRRMKKYFEHLASTIRPELAGHATYPAVNWFTFYELRKALASKGFETMDRFDTIDTSGKNPLAKTIIYLMRKNSVFKWLGQVMTPYTQIAAIKCRLPTAAGKNKTPPGANLPGG